MKTTVKNYRARLEEAKEYADILLIILKLLDDYITPDGISNEELANLFQSLDALYSFITILNGGR